MGTHPSLRPEVDRDYALAGCCPSLAPMSQPKEYKMAQEEIILIVEDIGLRIIQINTD